MVVMRMFPVFLEKHWYVPEGRVRDGGATEIFLELDFITNLVSSPSNGY
jgi:hypothetical protein